MHSKIVGNTELNIDDLNREQLIGVIHALKERNMRQATICGERYNHMRLAQGETATVGRELSRYKKLFWHLYWRKS